jgi:hypothetical protein
MMVMLCVSLPLEGIVLGTIAGWWKQEVEWCSSTASKTPSLGGVVQWGLGDGCVKMNSHRAGAPSGVMVASMASLVRGFATIFQPGVGSADRGVKVTSEACAQGTFFGYHQGMKSTKMTLVRKFSTK